MGKRKARGNFKMNDERLDVRKIKRLTKRYEKVLANNFTGHVYKIVGLPLGDEWQNMMFTNHTRVKLKRKRH